MRHSPTRAVAAKVLSKARAKWELKVTRRTSGSTDQIESTVFSIERLEVGRGPAGLLLGTLA